MEFAGRVRNRDHRDDSLHDREEVDTLRDRIALIGRDRVRAEITPAMLKAQTGANATRNDVFEMLTRAGCTAAGTGRAVDSPLGA